MEEIKMEDCKSYKFYDLQTESYSAHDTIEDLFYMICDGYCECGEGYDVLDESDGKMKCINCWNINNIDKVSLEEMKNEIIGHDYRIEEERGNNDA